MTHSFPTRRSSGLAPTGAGAWEIEGSVVVVFALVADGEDGDGAVVVDFEQCDVSGLAEADQQFAEQWCAGVGLAAAPRSEEHTSELPSLMRISYAVFCLKKKTHIELLVAIV